MLPVFLLAPAAAPPDALFSLPASPELGITQRGITIADLDGDGRPDLLLGLAVRQAVAPLLGNGDGTFRTLPGLPVGGWVNEVRVADLNRDGRADVITVNDLTSSLSVLLGTGATGTNLSFGPPRIYRLGASPEGIALGDFNGDGRSDVAVALFGQPDVAVLLTGTNGAFSATNRFDTGSEAWSIAASDFDANGTVDLVVAGDYDYNLRLLTGRGNGTFGLTNRIALGAAIRFVTLGDFNGDTRSDLAALGYDGQAVVLTNAGAFRFAVSTQLTLGLQLHSAVAGDFNRDGRLDLACTDGGLNVLLLPGNGNGGFGSPTLFWAGPGAGALAVGDLNGDGNPDVVTANDDGPNPGILLGRGNGSFRTLRDFAAAPHLAAGLLLDVTRDGLPDLITTGWDGNRDRAGVLSVETGTADGRFLHASASEVPAGGTPVAAADLDRDGRMDLLVGNTLTNELTRWKGSGTGTFTNVGTVRLGLSNAFALALGQLDADAAPDLAVISTGQTLVEIHLNDGTGAFGPARLLSGGAEPQDVAISAPDTGGRMWVGTANRGDQTATVFRGAGDGNFGAAFPLPLPGGGRRLLFADCDQDGLTDLVVASGSLAFDNTTISFFWGTANGFWLVDPTNYVTGLGAASLAVADYNGDGWPDLAIGSQGTATVGFLLGAGSRRFVSGRSFIVGPHAQVVAADLDTDGRPDLGVLSTAGNCVALAINASIPALSVQGLPGGTSIRLSWPAWRGWALETGTNWPTVTTVTSWSLLASNVPALDGRRNVTNSVKAGAALFRLMAP